MPAERQGPKEPEGACQPRIRAHNCSESGEPMGKSDPDSHKGWPWWAPRKRLWMMVLGVVAGQAKTALGRTGPEVTPTWPCPPPAPPPVPHTPTGAFTRVLTPLLASADEECIRVSEDSWSPPCVSDLASAQPPSGNAHGGSRATDGARGQRLAGGPPALPHQRIGPRRFRRICMDCSAANRPPGMHTPNP